MSETNSSSRAIWKGHITFGFVEIPVELRPAVRSGQDVKFHFLDGRSLEPVAFRRVNRTTGKEVPWKQIVRGYEYENGRHVVRKGACPAHDGQTVVIPGSMGASSYLCVGKGNDRFLHTASHGAGRVRSRNDMSRVADLGLDGVDCVTPRPERRVEEAPAAYKDIDAVVGVQVAAGVVDVVARLRPLLTFKA